MAKLLRTVGAEIEDKNTELDEFLVNLDLDTVRSVEEREKVWTACLSDRSPLLPPSPFPLPQLSLLLLVVMPVLYRCPRCLCPGAVLFVLSGVFVTNYILSC